MTLLCTRNGFLFRIMFAYILSAQPIRQTVRYNLTIRLLKCIVTLLEFVRTALQDLRSQFQIINVRKRSNKTIGSRRAKLEKVDGNDHRGDVILDSSSLIRVTGYDGEHMCVFRLQQHVASVVRPTESCFNHPSGSYWVLLRFSHTLLRNIIE